LQRKTAFPANVEGDKLAIVSVAQGDEHKAQRLITNPPFKYVSMADQAA
jgi:hypothetical protein